MGGNNWKAYFAFSKKDRIGLLIVIIIILASILIPEYYKNRKSNPVLIIPLAAADSSVMQVHSQNDVNEETRQSAMFSSKGHVTASAIKPFTFNPNTLSEDGWKKLGLRERTIATILKYRSKGGYFKNAEDIRKIYGLRKEEADILIPYIIIEQTKNESFRKGYQSYENRANAAPAIIDINTADVYAWKRLPGMSPSVAYKIVNFRDKINGFFSVEEIRQTYGITDSLWQNILPYLKLNTETVNKLNINVASEFQMAMHNSVFTRDVAKAIVIYRNQNGPYTSVSDVKKIAFINDAIFKRIEPFIDVK